MTIGIREKQSASTKNYEKFITDDFSKSTMSSLQKDIQFNQQMISQHILDGGKRVEK